MEIKAFAKVNLYLDIVGQRRDGYHELVTLMCPIELYDTLRLSFESRKIDVSCDHPDVPGGPENIAHSAASRFLAASGRQNNGVAIEIKKNIPVGAGLGGGSSDAAAVLSGLNMHFGSPLSCKALLEIAKTIGSDVPFFLYGEPAVAEGIGEIVTPLSGLRPLPIVLIYPRYVLSTRAVYKNFNLTLTKKEKIHTKNIFKLDWSTNLHRLLFNALEPSAFALSPQIREIKEKLLDSGASGALMSGSGSSVYGVYNESETADKAFNRLSREHRWQVFRTRLMA